MVATNDIKKGTRVRLRNGWYGTMADNLRGHTRLVDVEGVYREIGSVYATDIVKVKIDDKWVDVEHTQAQKDVAKKRAAMGF